MQCQLSLVLVKHSYQRMTRKFTHVWVHSLNLMIPVWTLWYWFELDDTGLNSMIPVWTWWYRFELDGTGLNSMIPVWTRWYRCSHFWSVLHLQEEDLVQCEAIFFPAAKSRHHPGSSRLLCSHAVLWHPLLSHHCLWSSLIWSKLYVHTCVHGCFKMVTAL